MSRDKRPDEWGYWIALDNTATLPRTDRLGCRGVIHGNNITSRVRKAAQRDDGAMFHGIVHFLYRRLRRLIFDLPHNAAFDLPHGAPTRPPGAGERGNPA